MTINQSNLCQKYSDGQKFDNKESPEWTCFHLCWHSVPAWHLLTLLLLPSTLYLLYHVDRVPDQDSGARTWSWLYFSCAKSWCSPDLPYRQLHQKGADRMCSCCDWKGKASICIAPQSLSTRLHQGVIQSNCVYIQEIFFFNFPLYYDIDWITGGSYFSSFLSSVRYSSCTR